MGCVLLDEGGWGSDQFDCGSTCDCDCWGVKGLLIVVLLCVYVLCALCVLCYDFVVQMKK